MKKHPITKEMADKVKELYKCHYTRKEAKQILGISYNAIVTLYRTFDSFKEEKYSRALLMPWTSKVEIFHDGTIDLPN